MTNTDGYISIDVNGEKLGLKFGMLANEWFINQLEEDKSLMSADGEPSLIGAAYLIYYGYLNNCKHKGTKEAYNMGYFLQWIEEVSIDPEKAHVLEDIGVCYRDSRFTHEWIRRIDAATEEVKKKMIGSTLNHSATENLD